MPINRRKIIACATVFEEMEPLLGGDVAYEVLDFGLHLTPEKLLSALQERIDSAAEVYDTIILGYGICSMAVVGLKANNCTLIVPKVDDCIAIFLGSYKSYKHQVKLEPGTYYLTKGWIEVGDTPFDEYKRMVEVYGQKRAERMMKVVLHNYKRLVYIDTGRSDQDRYRQYPRQTAEQFDLRYEEIRGSNTLVRKMLYGPWDKNFVIVPPGDTITFMHFREGGDINSGQGKYTAEGDINS